ncbi:MAG: hypothetical protein J4G14_09715 [Dehalococcoidia bacterium]|nr:hypothetical protein [Dehalococcoidia bacterium]
MTQARQYPIRIEGITPRRLRLLVSVGLYGAALGGAALLVNFLARTDPPHVPQHMPVDATILLSGGAASASGILAVLMTLWMSNPSERERARGLLIWLLAGFGFGVLSPVATGAALPLAMVFLATQNGDLPSSDFLVHATSAILQAPSSAFTHGVFGLFTGLMAGGLFGIGSWVLDWATHSSTPKVPAYVPYVLAAILSGLFYGVAAFGPVETLARFG